MGESVERSLARVRSEVPDAFRDDDPDFADLYRESYREQLRFIYSAWEDGHLTAAREPPGILAEEGRQASRRGIKLGSMLLAYRTCHRLVFEEALEEANEQIADQALLAATVLAASRWLFAYFDAATLRISEAYELERELLARDRDRRKSQLVRDLLDGELVDTSLLGYRMDQAHLAVIAWGEAPGRALSSLRDDSGLELLAVEGTGTTAWGWLGGRVIGGRTLHALRTAQPPPDTQLALGEPGSGLDGFKLSHRQAWRTYGIARDGDAAVTDYSSIALLVLTAQDPGLAREFAVRELGPLADMDARSAVLRETLSTYFDSGQNAASAAASLGVRDRTVRYRLRSIEEQLGYPITSRREELGIALRLAPVVLNGSSRR